MGTVLKFLGGNWILFALVLLMGAVTVQGNLLVEKNQKIAGLEIAARMLNSQLVELQVKAEIIDRLRRKMHNETITLRDELASRRSSDEKSVEAIMLQPVSRQEYESIQWLHKSIRDLNFGSPP